MLSHTPAQVWAQHTWGELRRHRFISHVCSHTSAWGGRGSLWEVLLSSHSIHHLCYLLCLRFFRWGTRLQFQGDSSSQTDRKLDLLTQPPFHWTLGTKLQKAKAMNSLIPRFSKHSAGTNPAALVLFYLHLTSGGRNHLPAFSPAHAPPSVWHDTSFTLSWLLLPTPCNRGDSDRCAVRRNFLLPFRNTGSYRNAAARVRTPM